MILNFNDDKGKRHFEFCFVGFIIGGSMQDKKGITVLRRELVILQKLESISEPRPCGKKLMNGELERQLTSGEIELDDMEFDLLYGYISVVPWQTGGPGRYALETLDWLVLSKNV